MTIDDAIRHCEHNITKEMNRCNFECAAEHRQLRDWLMQLKVFLEEKKDERK